jgi:hypothetical protein
MAPSRGIPLSPQAKWLGVLPCKRVKQVSYGEQCETKNGTPEIDVMTDALLEAPRTPVPVRPVL